MEPYVSVFNGIAALGTILWDGVSPIDLPPGVTLVREADYVGPRETLPVTEANERTLRDRADQAIAAMQAHIDRGTFTNAQRDAALLLSLRVNVALARLTLGRLEST
jgi:hypothetical protein